MYTYRTLLGLNSYVYDDDKSIKSGLKFIKPFGVPLLPLFATFGTTAERKIIEILICDYPIRLPDDPIIRFSDGFIRLSEGPIGLSEYHSRISEGPIS
jgi:hypothetical protein